VNPIDHLIYAPGSGKRCGHVGCAAKADNYARCKTCRAVVARCCYHGPAIEKRDGHCEAAR